MSTIGLHLAPETREAIKTALLTATFAAEVADAFGVGLQTVQRIAREMRKAGLLPPVVQGRSRLARQASPAIPSTSPGPQPTPAHERRIIHLEDELRDARAKLKDAYRVALNDDVMATLLGIIAKAPPAPPEWLHRVPVISSARLGEVPVLTWTDWHLGETVSLDETNGVNAYDMEIARKRIRRLVDNTIHLCTEHVSNEYQGAVLNLLGDFCSGGLHPELAKTDELEILPTILAARDLLLWGIRRIADAFGKVYVPCVAGNHGRMTQKPEFKRYAYKNADWVIYKLLERDFAEDDRVTIDVRPANEIDYTVYGLRVKVVHGDMLGVKGGDGIIGALGPIVRGEIKLRGQSSTIGKDFDILLMGHWHQQLWLPRVMVSNCLKGFDEYARLSLRAAPTPPSQPLFFVNQTRGITSRWDIHVEDPRKPSSEWVTWQKQVLDPSSASA